MTAAQQAAFDKIQNCVNTFDRFKANYKADETNETETRTDFIDPFFEALGWDMKNWNGLPPLRQQVRREQGVQDAAADFANKRPDYSFRDNTGRDIFYLEAKRPSIDVNADRTPAVQVRTYGWHGKLKIGIVTDFEEFAVFDCRVPIQEKDNSLTARTDYFLYTKYTDTTTFKYLWEYFEQSNVQKGSLDRYLQDARNNFAKQAKPVDDAFLESLQTWRKNIAMAVFKNNANLTIDQLNYIVQITLNRIVFLRNCEDRNIEQPATLHSVVNPDKKQADFGYEIRHTETLFHTNKKYDEGLFYKRLLKCFENANSRYNAGLFDLSAYNGLAHRISIDNDSLKTILEGLYFPASPYRYDLIDTDILGSAYERFLGEVLIIKDKLNAQGKYTTYTDTNIRVKEVVPELKPEVRKAGGVFYTPQYIVRYIIENTIGKLIEGKTPEQISALAFCDPACGSGSFLIGVYKYLIEYHIEYYGKIAFQQGSTQNLPLTSASTLTVAEKKRILTNNIYGVDIDAQAIEVTKLSLMLTCLEDASENESKNWAHILPNLDHNIQCGNSLISPSGRAGVGLEFDWKTQFPNIFAPSPSGRAGVGSGGFDAVVGNPPYVNTKRGFAENPLENAYFKNNYVSATGQFDAYTLFIERFIQLQKKQLCWGLIIPKPILTNENMQTIRNLIIEKGGLSILADCGRPFKDANVEAVVLCQNHFLDNKESTQVDLFENDKIVKTSFVVKSMYANAPKQSFLLRVDDGMNTILAKIENDTRPLKDFIHLFTRGIESGKKDDAITTAIQSPNSRKLIRGLDVQKYNISYQNLYITVDFKDTKKFKNANLYETDKKIVIRRVGSDLQATIDTENYWNLNTIYNLQLKDEKLYEIITAIFNSKVISFWFKKKFVFEDKLFPYTRVSQLETIPIIKDIPRKITEQIITLVSTILTKKAVNDSTAAEEAAIDALVYHLYGLTEAEIRIVEGA